MAQCPGEITRLLVRIRNGNRDAAAELIPIVYSELKRLASGFMRRERSGHTLQPTALVNEAFLRLVVNCGIEWRDRAHFFGVAARLMREILVDYARKHTAVKRDGGFRVTLDDSLFVAADRLEEIVAIDEILERLANLDARQARIVELRFFAGLNVEEVAEAMDISTPTVKREWSLARAWLHREITHGIAA